MDINIINRWLKFNGILSLRKSTNYIILHHASKSSCTVEDVHSWHLAKGWAGIGYNFFVRKNGEIFQGRPLITIGAHTESYNNTSIGICCEGNYHEIDMFMPKQQLDSLVKLISYIKKYYTSVKVIKHSDVNFTACPGKYFPFNDILLGTIKGVLMMSEYEELSKRISRLENAMVYNYIDANTAKISYDANECLKYLKERGHLRGNEKGELGLTLDMIRMLIINWRAGLYK